MNAKSLAALLVVYARRLRAPAIALACTALLAAACSGPVGSSQGNSHRCADLVVQSLTTNGAVKGLWSCLDSTVQNDLHAYGSDGDGALADGTTAKPPVLGYHYVTTANGVALYTVILQSSSGTLKTAVISVWLDTAGKVSNVGVDFGSF